MQRVMLKSKIHRATATACDLHYVGSIKIDELLLEAADLYVGELVHVLNINTGARFETYTILGDRGSGDVQLNGAAARLVHTGDLLIVAAYGTYDETELATYEPRVVHVDLGNRIVAHGSDPARLVSVSEQ
jgi:aspartate 1-decarboxylase